MIVEMERNSSICKTQVLIGACSTYCQISDFRIKSLFRLPLLHATLSLINIRKFDIQSESICPLLITFLTVVK